MENKEFITSYKFAKISNVIYSGVFLENQIEDLNISDFNVVSKNNGFLYIRNKKFTLKENDVIFCRTEDIKSLFYILKNNQLKNIKLVTHQSDLSVKDKHIKLKPECISSWYSVNVDSSSEILYPIPIGLSNEHFKNLNSKDFDDLQNEKIDFFKTSSKNTMMLVNFQKSTNLNERGVLYEFFKDKTWVKIDDPDLSKDKYLQHLKASQFILSPHGNGIDTHRMWEALYSGSIPITKYHLTYECLENLPVLFVKDYKEINEKLLLEFLEQNNHNNYAYEKMFFQYWKDIIEKDKIISFESFELNTNKVIVKLLNFRFLIIDKLNSYLKIIKYYLRKIKNIF